MSKKTTAQRIFLSQMKQQAIKEKLQKSLPANQNVGPENYAATFRPPTNSSSLPEFVSKASEICQTVWPVTGSSVIIRLDAETTIEGVVTESGPAAEELRLGGLISVFTKDGHFIEVPYPDENVTVIHNIDTANSSSNEVLRHNTGRLLLNNRMSIDENDVLDVENILSLRTVSSENILRVGTSLGKNVPEDYESSLTANTKGALIVAGNEDDDVEWVEGHESLNAKRKKRTRRTEQYGDDLGSSEESDEEEVHWQTPSDSADIDIEVEWCIIDLFVKVLLQRDGVKI